MSSRRSKSAPVEEQEGVDKQETPAPTPEPEITPDKVREIAKQESVVICNRYNDALSKVLKVQRDHGAILGVLVIYFLCKLGYILVKTCFKIHWLEDLLKLIFEL